MIYTKMDRLERYYGICDALDTAIRHLLSADLSVLHKGRNEVSGEDVYINRFGYDTMTPEEAIWEGHADYGDMHVVLEGHEKIGVSDAARLNVTTRKPEEDFIGYEGPVESWSPMAVGDILIVFPEDVHLVKVTDGEASHVEKAVYKFKV